MRCDRLRSSHEIAARVVAAHWIKDTTMALSLLAATSALVVSPTPFRAAPTQVRLPNMLIAAASAAVKPPIAPPGQQQPAMYGPLSHRCPLHHGFLGFCWSLKRDAVVEAATQHSGIQLASTCGAA